MESKKVSDTNILRHMWSKSGIRTTKSKTFSEGQKTTTKHSTSFVSETTISQK